VEGVTFLLRTLTAREMFRVRELGEGLMRRHEEAVAKAREDQPDVPEEDLRVEYELPASESENLLRIIRIAVAGWEGAGAPGISGKEERVDGCRMSDEAAIERIHPSLWLRLYAEVLRANSVSGETRGN
jgi:hypothetical protein